MRLQLVCALLLIGASAEGTAQAHLGTYSETRSFRDALDGRSMEEAMTGPVDKDTSSYGDRTPNGNNNQMPSLSIPANGNLMPMRDNGGGELEREAGPIGAPAGSMEDQQRMMEQRTERQRASGQSTRQSPAMAGQRLASNGRQQQQQLDQTDGAYEQKGSNGNGKTSASDAGFGEETSSSAKGGRNKAAIDMPMKMAYDDQQQPATTMQPGETGDQQQQQQQAAKQRISMAAMLMSMNKALKYSRGTPSSSYQAASGAKSGTDGGMMMPLGGAGKTPGASGQQRRQIAPPMMSMGGSMVSAMNYGMGQSRSQKQRRLSEKKMSPSMVNAMLKKMLTGQPMSASGSYGGGPAGGASKPAAMAMLIKSPAGAELLTNMMAMPQVAGAVAGMAPAKREQYKRMMMAAVMQQASAQDETSGEDEDQQQQQGDDAGGYGQQARGGDTMEASPAPGSKGAKSYANQQMPSSTMSPMSLMMMMNMMKESKYAGQQQQQQSMDSGDQQTTEAPMSLNNGSKGKKSYNMEQQQQQQQRQMMMSGLDSSMNGYGGMNNNEQRRDMTPMAIKMMTMMKANQMRQQYGTTSTPASPMAMMMGGRTNGKTSSRFNQQHSQMDAQQMKEDSKGGQNSYNMDDSQNSNEADQQQQTMVSTTEATTGSYASQEAMDAPTMASIMMNTNNNNRPTTPASPVMNGMRNQVYNNNNNNQRQQQETSTMASGIKGQSMSRPAQAATYGGASSEGSAMDEQKEQQQQQQDEYNQNGAAPMGMAEPFAFDYKIEDDYGNGQYRKEESDKNGVVRGSYGYMDNSGIYRHVDYVADENGFRANVKSNEPGLNGGDSKSSQSIQNKPQMMSQMMNGNGMAAAQMSPAALAQMMNQMSQMTMTNGMGGASYGGSQQQQQQSMQQQQQQQMLMPAQQELNENGEK